MSDAKNELGEIIKQMGRVQGYARDVLTQSPGLDTKITEWMGRLSAIADSEGDCADTCQRPQRKDWPSCGVCSCEIEGSGTCDDCLEQMPDGAPQPKVETTTRHELAHSPTGETRILEVAGEIKMTTLPDGALRVEAVEPKGETCSYCAEDRADYHMCQDCMDMYQKMDKRPVGFVKQGARVSIYDPDCDSCEKPEQWDALHAEIDAANDQLARQHKLHYAAMEDIDELQRLIDVRKKSEGEARDEAKELEASVDSLASSNDDLRGAAKKYQAEVERLNEKIRSLTHDVCPAGCTGLVDESKEIHESLSAAIDAFPHSTDDAVGCILEYLEGMK